MINVELMALIDLIYIDWLIDGRREGKKNKRVQKP